ncbi:MAG: SMP-30/gluconolactonase/LRE family protein [Alphaproteobacteria bacterium]
MNGWYKAAAVTGLAALSGLAWLALDAAIHAGVFRRIYHTANDRCRPIKAPLGIEDVAIDRTTGWVYLSAADWRWGQGGGLYAMHLDAPGDGIVSLTGTLDEDLYPRGIGLWIGTDEKRLFAALPARGARKAAVAVFGIDETGPDRAGGRPALTRIATIESEQFQDLQDVAPASADTFYATVTGSDRPSGGLLRQTDILMRRDTGAVLHFDGTQTRQVAGGLTFANGVVLDEQRQRLYVTETTEGTLRIFDRLGPDGALAERDTVAIGPGPDNLDLDGQGRLWVAGHPRLLALGNHGRDGPSPSLVQRIKNGALDAVNHPTRTVYADPGTQLSGSSAAAVHNGRLVIGSLFDPHLLICEGIE